jgi:hypothetical protein
MQNFDLWPQARDLEEVERKFGDGLTNEDVTGIPKRKKKRPQHN